MNSVIDCRKFSTTQYDCCPDNSCCCESAQPEKHRVPQILTIFKNSPNKKGREKSQPFYLLKIYFSWTRSSLPFYSAHGLLQSYCLQ